MATQTMSRAALWSARRALSSCTPRAPPPCPPCVPTPPPPCRRAPTEQRTVTHVVCQPPSSATRPPCPPCPPAQPLTCTHRVHSKSDQKTKVHRDSEPRSSDAMDRVSRRLEIAKRVRREEYEREVAERRARKPAPPPAPAAPATVVVQCEPVPPRHCRVDLGAALDPCAHRPRVVYEVKRDEPAAPALPPPPPPPPPAQAPARAPGWCSRPPPPAAPPQRCKRPSIVDRLRSRPTPSETRDLHTAVGLFHSARRSGSLDCVRLKMDDCRKNPKNPVNPKICHPEKTSPPPSPKPPPCKPEKKSPPRCPPPPPRPCKPENPSPPRCPPPPPCPPRPSHKPPCGPSTKSKK